MKTNQAEMASQKDMDQHVVDSNDGTLKLGGNIELQGFTGVDPAQMVVVKKMVGSYVRKLSDSGMDPEKVVVLKDGDKIKVNINAGDQQLNSEESNSNVFFGLDSALSKTMEKL